MLLRVVTYWGPDTLYAPRYALQYPGGSLLLRTSPDPPGVRTFASLVDVVTYARNSGIALVSDELILYSR